jgi:hypothetical protein
VVIWAALIAAYSTPAKAQVSVTVPGVALVPLAGQPAGTSIDGRSAPSNSPVQVNIPIVPGQALHIAATGISRRQAAGWPEQQLRDARRIWRFQRSGALPFSRGRISRR